MEQTSNTPVKLLDIDKVFKEKNPSLYKLIPKFILSYIKRITHQEDLNKILTDNPETYGVDFGQACMDTFKVRSKTVDLDKINTDGRYLFVANHPLGGLDGIIFMVEVGKVFDDIKFPVNDILLHIGRFNDIFVPINKHGGQAREAAKKIEESFASESQVLFFPAGLVSRKNHGKIADLEWKTAFIKKAIQHKRDIIPVHIEATNSNFFYNLSRFRTKLGIKSNIEMLYLVDEMFKQKNKDITLTFGTPIEWERLKTEGDTKYWAEKIKETVYRLPK